MFLGRTDEQRRFNEMLSEIQAPADDGGSPVMLIQGLGGMGKTELIGRYRDLVKAVKPTAGSRKAAGSPLIAGYLDFEEERRNAPDAYPAVAGPQLLTVLAAIYSAIVRDASGSSQRTKQIVRAFERFWNVASQVPYARELHQAMAGPGSEQPGTE